MRPNQDISPLREILATERLVELNCGFIRIQNIQAYAVTTFLSRDAGHLTQKHLPDTTTAKPLPDEKVLKEYSGACPSGVKVKEKCITSWLSIQVGNNGAELRLRTKAVAG